MKNIGEEKEDRRQMKKKEDNEEEEVKTERHHDLIINCPRMVLYKHPCAKECACVQLN